MQTIDLSQPSVHFIPLDMIFTAPQVRTTFDEDKLAELATSIKNHGMLQPLLLRPDGDNFMVIAGERRLRAAKLAGLTHVPAFAGEMPTEVITELQLIENIQREELGMHDTAAAVASLVKKHGALQPVSALLGKSLSWISKQITASEKLGHWTQQAAGDINDLETLLVMNQIERLGKWFPRGMNLAEKIGKGKAGRKEARELLTTVKEEIAQARKDKKANAEQKSLELGEGKELPAPKWNVHQALNELVTDAINNTEAPDFEKMGADLDKDQLRLILDLARDSHKAGKDLAKKDELTKLYAMSRFTDDYPQTEETAAYILGITGQAYTLPALLEACRRVNHG
jgi:ParB/RepB/Spo0J family partition protein